MEEGIALLQRKYREMTDLTRPKCLGECPEPGGCCRPDYCSQAEARALAFGIHLPRQPHPTLPYMGEEGCVVPPYLRPLCAVHICEFHLLDESAFSRAYFDLRKEVCRIEEDFGPGWPEGMARDYWE